MTLITHTFYDKSAMISLQYFIPSFAVARHLAFVIHAVRALKVSEGLNLATFFAVLKIYISRQSCFPQMFGE